MSIYDLPLVVADALAQALTPSNIMSGFRAAGIMPFNRGIFQESAFLSSYVTDHEDTLPCKETDFGTLVGGPTRPALHNYYPKNERWEAESCFICYPVRLIRFCRIQYFVRCCVLLPMPSFHAVHCLQRHSIHGEKRDRLEQNKRQTGQAWQHTQSHGFHDSLE